MIKSWWEFEDLVNQEHWSGLLARAGNYTREGFAQQVFEDPRAAGLAGLRLMGPWDGTLFNFFRENLATLSSLEQLIVMVLANREEILPLRYFLEAFPGLEHLTIHGKGSVESVRHGFLKSLAIHTYFPDRSRRHTVGTDLDVLEALSNSVFPKLESLTLGFMRHYPNEKGREQLETHLPSLLTGETFPQLSRLGFASVVDPNLAEWITQIILACETPGPQLSRMEFGAGDLRLRRYLDRLEQWEPYRQGKVDFDTRKS